MGKLLIAFVVVVAACEGEPPPPPAGDCPAAGPCEEGEVPIDCGVCDLDEGTWGPCTTAQEPGEYCPALGDRLVAGFCRTCDDCAEAWDRKVDVFGQIDCPSLPFDDVVIAR